MHTLDELESAMIELRNRDRPVLIEVSLDPEVIAVSPALSVTVGYTASPPQARRRHASHPRHHVDARKKVKQGQVRRIDDERHSKPLDGSLLGVFNEHDGKRRAAAIRSTYAPDVRWTDDEGVSVGREGLEARAQGLQQRSQGFVFTKASPVYETLGFGYLAWHLGPEGGDSVACGFDAAIVRNDVIAELYTVITK